MASLSTIKPFLPFLLTFLVPRGIAYYRAIKTAIKTRPPPRPLPAHTSRVLNVLFFSICLFFFMSFPSYWQSYQPNIFEITKSRLHTPTDVLFTRLALVRPLTPFDEALREKVTTPISRQIYLRFGPTTLLNCPFCHPTDPTSYVLYHLPTNILLQHLTHFLLLGLATSTPISGPSPSPSTLFRTKLSLSALALATVDISVTTSYTPTLTSNSASPPWGIYWTSLTLRPLSIAILDIAFASLIYLSATNRLPFLFPAATSATYDPGTRQKQQSQLMTQSSVALQMALAKLRAFSVARSAVVRDESGLKGRDDEYWRAVVAMEGVSGTDGGGGVWEEEEVMEAVARVTNRAGAGAPSGEGGGVDVERVGREAGIFVESVTRGLEGDEGEGSA